MTSESDDLRLQRLTDINYIINMQKKWNNTRKENHSSIENIKVTNNNHQGRNTTEKEIDLIVENLRKLYWEMDILNELYLCSMTCKRLIELILYNLSNLENSLLAKISSLNLHNRELDNHIKRSEKKIYQYHFLQMILDNFKEKQLLETGQEYSKISNDIQLIIDLQKQILKGE
jgi:hypothetical protein